MKVLLLELFFIGGNLTELCLCIRNYYQFLILFDDNSSSTNLTSPAPETTSQVPEYAEEDYNNYTEASDNVYEVEEPTASKQQPLNLMNLCTSIGCEGLFWKLIMLIYGNLTYLKN